LKQLILDVRPDFQPSLANFVPGDNAALLAALAEQCSRDDGSLLYLWGESGSGRSHLLQAAAAISSTRPVIYAPAAQGIESPGPRGLLLVDDLARHDEAALAELFRLMINARTMQQSFIITGDVPPTALTLRADVASRVAQGLAFEIRPLSDAQKKTTLLEHARARGMQLPGELIDYLLRHSRRDLPWLMAVLDALDEASLSLARPITLPLLREILKTP
jgi:DnaA-homolog protein